jgi:hypothetical protein
MSKMPYFQLKRRSRHSSDGIVTSLRPVKQGFDSWQRLITFHHPFQTGSGAQPTTYPMTTGVSFPEGKADGATS